MQKNKETKLIFTGIDEVIFNISTTIKSVNRIKLDFLNDKGIKYGQIDISSKNIILKINIPKAMGKTNNLYPYKLDNTFEIVILQQKMTSKLEELFGNDFICEVKKIELSYLVAVNSKEDIENICHLFTDALCEEKRQTKVYMNTKVDKYLKIKCPGASAMQSPVIKNKFFVKIYNKGLELGLDADYLRIEFSLLHRYLKALFKNDMSIESVLSAAGFEILQNEFKRVYEKYLLVRLYQCLERTEEQLYERMVLTNKPIRAYVDMREHIHCLEEYKRALRRYASLVGMTANARNQNVHKIKEKYKLNNSVLEILNEFHHNC